MNNLVSIILPVRNGEKYIKKAIGSIINQTYPHWELIVIDASMDSTPEIAKSYADKRIYYFRQKSKGSVNGYNEALDKYVTGQYVTFIHHDDIYYPQKLYEQVRMIEKYADVDCVYNDIEFVDDDLNVLRLRGHEDFYHRNDDLLAVMMIGYGISNLGMQVLVKRDFFEKHHLCYSLKTPVCCDHAFIFDMIDAGAVFKHVQKPLFKYRIHNDNYSGDRDVVNRENLIIYSRYSMEQLKKTVERSNYSLSQKQIIFGKLLYRLGHIEEGNRYFEDILSKEENGWAAFYLGTGYYRYQGDFLNAEKWLRRGQKWMPYRPEFINNLGCCIFQMQGVPAAKPYFEKAAQLRPDYCDAKYNLEHAIKNEKFNPRLTDRETDPSEQIGIVWKSAEKKRKESGSLQPAGNI